jgi:pimeloyl-ACP methyl ester carboxylesterase
MSSEANLTARIETAIGSAQYRIATRGASRLFGFTESSFDVDFVRVPFLARGWGVPVVLVHGFGGDKESWLFTAGALARNHATLIPDLPGFGAAGAIVPERASPRAQADVLARLLDRLGYARAHIVGNSMGGGIALRFAADHPDRATSITLIGSVGPVVEKSEVVRALDRGENPLVVNDLGDLDRLLGLVSEKMPKFPRTMRRYIAQDRVARRDAQLALFRGWNQPKPEDAISPDLESLRTPALVIHGGRDRVIDVSTGRALAERLPNARLEVMEGIGHVPQMEAPVRVAKMIDQFVADVEARRVS